MIDSYIHFSAVKIYTGDSPNKYDILLQPGKEASGSLVYIWVKAFVFNGAHVIVPLQTHVSILLSLSLNAKHFNSCHRFFYVLHSYNFVIRFVNA